MVKRSKSIPLQSSSQKRRKSSVSPQRPHIGAKAGRSDAAPAREAMATALTRAAALPINDIVALAKASAVASHDWHGRGVAPIGYVKGMAVVYAEMVMRLQAGDATVAAIAAARNAHDQKDALVWYGELLANAGLADEDTPTDRLRLLFVLMFGLGMRESSGRFCEGRDRSTDNITAATAEAGLFQTSFDITRNRPALLDLFNRFSTNPHGHVDIFKEKVTVKPKDLENFGDEGDDGFKFQDLSKTFPDFAIEMAALGLRSKRSHWGPVNRFEVEILPAAAQLCSAIEQRVGGGPITAMARAALARSAAIAPVVQRATADASEEAVADKYMEPVDLDGLLPINDGLSSAKEETMVSILGSPQMPLTTSSQPERASALVKRNQELRRMSPQFRLTGLKPALDDIQLVLAKAFAAFPDLERVLSTEGMLSVRLRKPTSGAPSTKISNHSWGTAVDFKIKGAEAPGNTGDSVPRFIAILIPLFNAVGWYSGVGFRDSMHFEVSEQRIRKWSDDGILH